MRKALYVLLLLVVVLAWRDWTQREIVHPPGVLAPESPRQSKVADPRPFTFKGYRLTPRAEFDIHARVLSREDYRWGREADLSPMDLALGWGVMSDQAVLDRIDITQGSRWYYTRYDYPAPLADADIIRNSSNMHMLPADAYVLRQLKKLRRGDVLRAKGFLVDIDDATGFQWRTSLTRSDTGNGACEIFYVERLFLETGS